ncbi:MAG: TetR/AcrR family transcriptional regulator [Candidatus Dormibacteria bacterium]
MARQSPLQVAPANSDTRQRILDAAIETLRQEGFAGTSARAIARRGEFNQALIFYHYGSLIDLLLATLDETSRRRLDRYRDAINAIDDLPNAVRAASDLYAEDIRSGHMTVLAELISGASSVTGLGEAIIERMQPWVHFTEATLQRLIGDSPLVDVMPIEQMAHGVVALYLGAEMLTHLDGDQARTEALFASAQRTATVAPRLLRLFAAVPRPLRRRG